MSHAASLKWRLKRLERGVTLRQDRAVFMRGLRQRRLALESRLSPLEREALFAEDRARLDARGVASLDEPDALPGSDAEKAQVMRRRRGRRVLAQREAT